MKLLTSVNFSLLELRVEFQRKGLKISIIILARLFVDIDKLILQFLQKGTGPRIAKLNLTKKNKVGGITLYDI